MYIISRGLLLVSRFTLNAQLYHAYQICESSVFKCEPYESCETYHCVCLRISIQNLLYIVNQYH